MTPRKQLRLEAVLIGLLSLLVLGWGLWGLPG